MKVNVRFFASLKEQMGLDSLTVQTDPETTTVEGLYQYLRSQNPDFARVADGGGRIQVAVNQEMARLDSPIADNCEVAFFPPVTGG